MTWPEVCLLVQGPLNRSTIANLSRNLSLVGQCVVSTWNPVGAEQEEILRELRNLEEEVECLSVIVDRIDRTAIPHLDRGGLQFASTRNGLRAVRTKTVVKCRSDEEYDLQPFLEQLAKQPAVTLFSNFIVRDWSYHPFHISDHLFGAPTEVLTEALEKLFSRSAKQIDAILGKHSKTTESVLGFHLFEVSEPQASIRPHSPSYEFAQFTKQFNLFDLGLLTFYSLNANQVGIKVLTNIRSLRPLGSEYGYRLNYSHYSTLRQMRPRLRSYLWKRWFKPYARAVAVRFRLLLTKTRVEAERNST